MYVNFKPATESSYAVAAKFPNSIEGVAKAIDMAQRLSRRKGIAKVQVTKMVLLSLPQKANT